MNKTKMNGLMTALLITASFTVTADEAYAPADYKPAVDYDEYRSSAASLGDLDVAAPISAAQDAAQNSLQNTPPIVAVEIDQTDVLASSASTSAETPVMQNDVSAQTNLMPFIGLVTIAGGWVLFRRKYVATTSSSILRHAEVDSAAVSTGVERYVQKMADNKTGVDKYLERQIERAPSTGVAKYLAKQAVRDNIKS